MVVRTSVQPATLARSVRQALLTLDANLPVLGINTVDEQLDDVLVQERLLAWYGGVLAVLAASLSALGLYGVISHSVARRTGEIGIRLAVGASPGVVRRMVLLSSLRLVAIGILIGLPLALAAAGLASARLFDGYAADPLTLALATLVIVGAGVCAGFLPARRASRADPIAAFRSS